MAVGDGDVALGTEYAVRQPDGRIIDTRIVAMNGGAFESFTHQTAHEYAKSSKGEVIERTVYATAWAAAPALPTVRRHSNSATVKQEQFIQSLLNDRDVPATLRRQVRDALPWTKDDAERFIPLLKASPRTDDGGFDPVHFEDQF
jgi:hypothetical protein